MSKKTYYEENRERILAYAKKYRAENVEKIKEYRKKYAKDREDYKTVELKAIERHNENTKKASEILMYLEKSIGYKFVNNKKVGARLRNNDYPRKVFSKLVRDNTTLTYEQIGEYVNISHAAVINNLNKFHYIDKHFGNVYNECIIDLNLDKTKMINYKPVEIKKDENIEEKDIRLKSIIIQLKTLTDEELNEFEQYRLKPFLNIRKKIVS